MVEDYSIYIGKKSLDKDDVVTLKKIVQAKMRREHKRRG